MNIGNAKILFCCNALSSKDTKATTAKPNQPKTIKPEPEPKPTDGSVYSGITDTVYSLSNNIMGWFTGSGKKGGNGDDNEKTH